jgi:hypothetical protein
MRRQGAATLSVGYGESDLRAPLGASMPGYFQDRKAMGVLDPLMAKAVVLQRGGTRGVLVALDLIGLGAEQVAASRAAVEKATGIPAAHVWVHATHTHTGIMVPRYFTSDAASIVPDIYPGDDDAAWVAQLPDRVADAVKAAVTAARPGPTQLGQTRAEKLAFYRRFKMKDGTVRTNPGRNNPDVVAPAGEVDPTLMVLRFPAARALVVVYGLHPDCLGGTRYSADYPAHLTARLRESLGGDWGILFLNAACGNINHIDVARADQKSGPEESARIGRALGDAALRALDRAEPVAVDALAFASQTVASRLRTVPPRDLAEAERLMREEPSKAKPFNGLFAPAALVLGRTKDREQLAEIAAMRLGPVGLVGMPGEIFVELAREVQHGSPFEPTRVIGLTNGAFGYIPHAVAYDEGGYESGYRSARFEPRTGHRWAEAAIGLLKQL